MDVVLNVVSTKVTQSMNADMMAAHSGEEVKKALFQMFPLKAPGLDGFRLTFFRSTGMYAGRMSPELFFGL